METKDEYLVSKRFLIHMHKILHGDHNAFKEGDILSFLESLEKSSPSKARSSVRIGISDVLSEAAHFDIDKVSIIDRNLLDCGLPTLSNFRLKFWKKYISIIKRGHISSEYEYYAIKGIINDSSSGNQDERGIMNEMIDEYENRF